MKKYKHFWVFWGTFFLLSNIIHAGEIELKYLEISKGFFPETATWLSLNDMKNLDKDSFNKIQQELKISLIASNISKYVNDSLMKILFLGNEYVLTNFYVKDLNSDSYSDVVYSGSSSSESDITIFWFGQKGNKFLVNQSNNLPVKLLSINPKTLGICSVGVGCCDSRVDEYYNGFINNKQRNGIRKITKKTEFVANIKKPLIFTSRNNLVLRETPHINDIYDDSSSSWAGMAIFGNILAKYLPGCSGRIIGQKTDESSRQWYFIVLDSDSSPLRFHAPYDVNAGWVEARDVDWRDPLGENGDVHDK